MRQNRSRPAQPKPRAPRSGANERGAASGDRVNLYDEVTARIISELEGGRLPWVQPWSVAACPAPGLPR